MSETSDKVKAAAMSPSVMLGGIALLVLIAMSVVARAGTDILLLAVAMGAGWYLRGSYGKKKEKG